MTNITWTHDLCFEAAKKCNTRREFRLRYAGAYKYARRHNIMDDACAHISDPFVWNANLVCEEAKKYKTRNEFHIKNSAAAQWATRNNMMDELFDNLLTFWDFESASKEAKKYQHREEFRVGSAGAAQWASRNNVFDIICEHMTLASKTDNDAVYIWKVLGLYDVYKIGITSKRLGLKRIDKVSKESGFDIDFFVMYSVDNALSVESKLLNVGSIYDIGKKFDGCTEFRKMNDLEFDMCLSILKESNAKSIQGEAA